jgi:exopolysaccharide biosynthesis protein
VIHRNGSHPSALSRGTRNVSHRRGLRGALCATFLALSVAFALSGVDATTPLASAATGLYSYPLSGASFGVSSPIHVVTFYGSDFAVKVGLARNTIDGGEETPSAMCQRTSGCVAAVNGDFFDVTRPGKPDPGDEVGGIIRNCVLLHTPEISHAQVDIDGESVSNSFNWSSTLDVNGTSVAVSAVNQELPMSYVGVNVPLKGTLLFTAPYALKTPTGRGRSTYEFVHVGGTTSPTTINTTAELKYVGNTAQAIRVRAGRVDVSAPVGSALATLAVGSTVSITTESTSGCDNIGGSPILLDDGVVEPTNPGDTYLAAPFARTVIGWTASDETVIMTVGGVDGREGATWSQLDAILQSLDVETALDLDGGTSTTLYANGRLVYPTARSERLVSTSLLVVQNQ